MRHFLKFFLAAVLLFWFAIPTLALAQATLNPCWTKADCESAKDFQGNPMGLWGKDTKRFPNNETGVSGCELDGGKEVGGECKGGKSTAINPKTNDEFCQPKGTGSDSTAKCYAKPPKITLQVPIPGLGKEFTGGIAVYIAYFYRFFVSALAVMAVVMVMWGGFKRIYAAGSPERVKDANNTIISAISGLAIALLSYTLLNLVNPKLVNLPSLAIEIPKKQGFGEWCGDEIEKMKENQGKICGQIYEDKSTRYKCRIKSCTDGGTGCFPDPDKPKKDDFLGYSCQENYKACKKVTDDNVEKYHGNANEERNVYESACNSFSKGDDMCTWVEYYGPMSNDDKCEWYSKDYRDKFCKDKTKCDDFNIFLWAGGIAPAYGPSGTEFAACHKDWCNLGCKAVWEGRPIAGVTIMEYWYCRRR